MITHVQAQQKMEWWLESLNLRKHCLAVEAAMVGYAEKFNLSENEKDHWAIAGLLHDVDYQKWPQEHPQKILNWLKENGADEELLNAVASHGVGFGIEPTSQMAKTLRAVDELTGLIVVVALVRPSKNLAEVTVDSVLGKWNKKEFARGVNRKEIEVAAKELGVSLEDHLQTVLSSMKKISSQLGL